MSFEHEVNVGQEPEDCCMQVEVKNSRRSISNAVNRGVRGRLGH